jgi:hypothetical protein
MNSLVNEVIVDNKVKVVLLIKQFLKKAKLESKGITSLTIGMDRKSLTGSFIFNSETNELYAQYPGYYTSRRGEQIKPIYIELGGIDWTINFITGLSEIKNMSYVDNTNNLDYNFPCCEKCYCTSRGYISNNDKFNKFFNKEGSLDSELRVITKKANRGPLLSIKNYQLKDSKVTISQNNYEYHEVGHKIYQCPEHELYIGVSLRNKDDSYNQHHVKPRNETDYGDLILNKIKSVL